MSDVLPNGSQASPDPHAVPSESRIDAAAPLPAPVGVSAPASSPAAGRASILVIDAAPLSLIATAGVLDTEGYACVCARTAVAALAAVQQQTLDILVCDVGDDATAMLDLLVQLRSQDGYSELPAVLIADQRWSGLEKMTDTLGGATRCLFKPIDPGSLLAVVDQLAWLPQVAAAHRKRGTRPGRPGWVSL